MSKQFWAVVAAVILVLVGVAVFNSHNKSSSTTTSNAGVPSNHVEGQGSTGVTFVEYGDYQCPYCALYYPTVKQIEAEYASKITYQFRNFPLTNVHPNAFAAARAAEAASLQGKFWQMHDLLYENNDPNGQSGWVASSNPYSYFEQFAKQLNLNLTKFKTDYASEQVNNTIQADLSAGNKLNLQGTPTFFIDGKQTQLANTTSAFQDALNAAIKTKTGQ